MRKLLIIVLLFPSIKMAHSENMFAIPDVNTGYKELMDKAIDNTLPFKNSAYMKSSINGKIKLRVSENNQSGLTGNKNASAAGNSVIIGEGVTINGDLIINNQINGDTYVMGR